MNAHPSSRGQTLPALAVALGTIAVVGVAFAILVSRPSAPASGGSLPSATPPASPSAPPKPSADPTTEPSKAPTGIKLESASGHDVRLVVGDQTGTLSGAASGHPGDGMSVRWHESIVEQAGPNAIKVTWVAFPNDDRIDLGVNDVDGPLAVVIVQAGPYPNTDALGEDRVVVLTFDRPVEAKGVTVQVLDETID